MNPQELRDQQQEQLQEAYVRLNGATPPDVRKNVYKSLTFFWLYADPPDGFTRAIQCGEEYVNNPRLLPSGGIWVNLACAYSQKARWLMREGGATSPDPALRRAVLNAIEQALRQDESWQLPFQFSLRSDHPKKLAEPEKYKKENDLEIFEDDAEIRAKIGLPAQRRAQGASGEGGAPPLPGVPGVPDGLTAHQTGPTSAAVTWAASPRAEKYRPFKKLEGVDTDFVALDMTSETRVILENLPAKAVVHFQVTAQNAAGESARSAEAAVTLS